MFPFQMGTIHPSCSKEESALVDPRIIFKKILNFNLNKKNY